MKVYKFIQAISDIHTQKKKIIVTSANKKKKKPKKPRNKKVRKNAHKKPLTQFES